MVVEESVSDRFIYELLKNGVYYIRNEAEIQKLLNALISVSSTAAYRNSGTLAGSFP